jgi:cytochrome c5
MSEHPNKAPSGLFSYFKQSPGMVIIAVVVVFALFKFISAPSTDPGANLSPEATAERIQKIGSLSLADVNRPARTGEEVFKAQCTACHGTGAAGAPKFADAGAWSARIKQGYEGLLNSALKGKGNMGAQGGGEFSDFEVGRAVVYMANAGGAKFAEPKKPEEKK